MAVQTEIVVGLNAAIIAVTNNTPRILTVQRSPGSRARSGRAGTAPAAGAFDALPFGPLDPAGDRTLERGLRRWIREQTGLEVGYVEQLYTFGDRHRDPSERKGGPRVISVAYLALVGEAQPSGTVEALWRDCYLYFPWEDWRRGRPDVIESEIAPALQNWVRSARDGRARRERQERSDIHFGLRGTPWVPERVLERYELMYEVGLVGEAGRDLSWKAAQQTAPPSAGRRAASLGRMLAYDHRRILATALGRLRGKLKYRPVVFELLPPVFTLLQLQQVVEALAGIVLHKQNLRRLVEKGGLVEGTGRRQSRTGGRPAELFRFRREVLRERPAPGVGLPGLRR